MESTETAPEAHRHMLAGIEVREEDVDSATGLVVVGVVVRIAAVIIFLLAIWEAYDWMRDPPPGGVGLSVIVGDTVRLVVTAALLYAAANLADVIVKATHEMRASRILLARQTYLMRQMGIAAGELKATPGRGERRGLSPGDQA